MVIVALLNSENSFDFTLCFDIAAEDTKKGGEGKSQSYRLFTLPPAGTACFACRLESKPEVYLRMAYMRGVMQFYNKHSPATSTGRGVFISATWGRFGYTAQAEGMKKNISFKRMNFPCSCASGAPDSNFKGAVVLSDLSSTLQLA
jgi:hypothetical protein